MHYDFIAISDADVPQAVEPVFQHVLTTYASEANKAASVWRAVPNDLLDFKPHEKTNPIRTMLVHQLLSERRFFAQFVGTEEPPVEEPPIGRLLGFALKVIELGHAVFEMEVDQRCFASPANSARQSSSSWGIRCSPPR